MSSSYLWRYNCTTDMLSNDPNKDTYSDSCNPSSSASSAANVASGYEEGWSDAAFIGFGIRGSFAIRL
jgi:hypothetical protein